MPADYPQQSKMLNVLAEQAGNALPILPWLRTQLEMFDLCAKMQAASVHLLNLGTTHADRIKIPAAMEHVENMVVIVRRLKLITNEAAQAMKSVPEEKMSSISASRHNIFGLNMDGVAKKMFTNEALVGVLNAKVFELADEIKKKEQDVLLQTKGYEQPAASWKVELAPDAIYEQAPLWTLEL